MTHRRIYSRIFNCELLYSLPGYLYFLYLLFPFRFWKPFVFANQTEELVFTVFFAVIFLLFALIKKNADRTFSWNKIDVCLFIYAAYLLCRFKYPLEKECLFAVFSVVCIYLYFRNFPGKQIGGLLFLLPAAGIIQIIVGFRRLAMPWENGSFITGIFNNTGLFGGFIGLGLLISLGLFLSCFRNKRKD